MLCHNIAKSEAVSQVCAICTSISLSPYYRMGLGTFFFKSTSISEKWTLSLYCLFYIVLPCGYLLRLLFRFYMPKRVLISPYNHLSMNEAGVRKKITGHQQHLSEANHYSVIFKKKLSCLQNIITSFSSQFQSQSKVLTIEKQHILLEERAPMLITGRIGGNP